MGRLYEPANEVFELMRDVMSKHHEELIQAAVKVDLLFISLDEGADEGHAITHGGFPAYSKIKVNNIADRALGHGDARLDIDKDKWSKLDESVQRAILDHELEHLALKYSKSGELRIDACGRPMIGIRQHDIQVGWFSDVARRNGEASIEVIQSREMIAKHGQELQLDLFKNPGTGKDSTKSKKPATLDQERAQKHVEKLRQIEKESIEQTLESDLDRAVELFGQVKRASTSALQRRLKFGYNKACRVMEELENRRVIGPPQNDGGAREILDLKGLNREEETEEPAAARV